MPDFCRIFAQVTISKIIIVYSSAASETCLRLYGVLLISQFLGCRPYRLTFALGLSATYIAVVPDN